MNQKIKKYLKIIDQIQKIRSKNNVNWMDLLRLAVKLDHKTTSGIMAKIYRDDQKVSALAKKLSSIK
jgi:hypothetical protein